MKMQAWREGLTDKESKHLAYWERNMIALRFADGWYYDDVTWFEPGDPDPIHDPRLEGWRRVLSLDSGRMNFHIPDDFDVGNLPQIEPNWDGHTTIEKWTRVAEMREIKVDEGE